MTFVAEFWQSRFPILHQEGMEGATRQFRQLEELAGSRLREHSLGSGTVVFAFKYRDGVILAADRRMVEGWFDIALDTAVKIKQLTRFSAMASAGMCSVIRYLQENMENACAIFSERFQRELSPDGQVRYLGNLLEKWWLFFLKYWYVELGMGIPILAAYDKALRKPRLFSFDESGFCFEPQFLTGTGCGFKAVQGLIIDRWQAGMNASSATELSLNALLCSGVMSHGVSDTRIVTPTIALIDKKGFRWVPKEEILEKKTKLLSEKEGLQCLLP
jgi:proteasome beta subunit